MRPRPEHAFTLVEILVVLVICAILLAALLSPFRSSKDAANRGKVLAAAQSYDQAIASFAADHMGRMPSQPTDWPVQEYSNGPLEPSTNAAGVRQPYLRRIPEPVGDGVVRVQTTSPIAGSTAPPGTVGVVAIRFIGAAPVTTYRVEVWAAKKHRLPEMTCWMGTEEVAGVKKC